MIISTLILLLALIFPKAVLGQASYNIVCPNDPNNTSASTAECYKASGVDPFLNRQNVYPGFISDPSDDMVITNEDIDTPCFLRATSTRVSGDDLLFNGTYRLNLSILEGSTLWYSGPLVFSNQTLGQIAPSSSKNLSWYVSLHRDAGNDYQNLSSVFDVDLNFVCATTEDWQPPVTNPESGIYLNEYIPQPSDDNEWVELYNDNNFDVILSGWQLDDIIPGGQGAITIPNIIIPAKSYYSINLGSGFLNNGGDSVNLINNLGIVIETVSYTSSDTTTSWSKQSDNSWCQALPTKGLVNNICYNPSTPTDGGQVQGTSSATASPGGPPSCNDPKPATPTNLTATTSGGNVILTWNHISAPYSSYLVAYGPTSTNILYGNPNVGSSNSYTVGGLTPGAQYCFYVRAQNGCMPGDRSSVVCVNSGSTVIPVESGPSAGFQPGVLGEQTTNETTITPTPSTTPIELGDIKGASESSCKRYYIPLLFIIAFILNCLYFKDEDNTNLTLPIIVSLTAFLIDWFILRRACCKVPTVYCQYFWIGNILAVLIPRFAFKHTKK